MSTQNFDELADLVTLSTNRGSEDVQTRVLSGRVASEYAALGRDAAISFLRGFWYGMGNTRREAIVTVARTLGLDVSAGDLS